MAMSVNANIKKIREAVENNKLVIFVGSGVSLNSNLPSWSGIIKEFAEDIGLDINKDLSFDDYLRIAQYYYNERGLKEYYDSIIKRFDKKAGPNFIHETMLNLNPAHIITTNYDDLIEQSLDNSQLVYDLVCEDIDLPYTPNGRLLIKMHGDLKRKNIVLKEDDYLLYSQRFKLIETFIKSLFVNHIVLFIGYSLQDMDLKIIMKWVKDILGEHFQRAYFLDSEEIEKSQVEINYFKNLGVNIISKFDIDTKYQNMKIKEIENEKGKNIVRCINYILDFENDADDIIDFFYEKLFVFKDLRRLRFKDLFEAMNIDIEYHIDDNSFIVVAPNNESKRIEILIEELKKIDSLDIIGNENAEHIKKINYKANFIKTTFLNANILGIKIHNYSNIKDIIYKFELIYKSNELEIINRIKINNYLEIRMYCEQTYKNINVHKNKYFNELIRAYSNYLLHRYASAYEILKKLSQKAYKNKEYTVFYISEFNKKQLVRFINNYYEYGETVYTEHVDRIKEEAHKESKRMDLRELYYMLPKKERATISSLNDVVVNENYISDKKAKISDLKEKIGQEVLTLFMGKPKEGGAISELKREVHEFWEYTHNYFLMIDEYSDIKNYYYNYICVLLNTYSKKKEELTNEKDTLFPMEYLHIMPDYEFDEFDLHIMYRYMESDKFIKLFTEYEVEKIKVSVPMIFYTANLHNIIQSYINIEYKKVSSEIICNMFVVGGNLNFTIDDLNIITADIILLFDNCFLNLEIYKALNYFMVKSEILLNQDSSAVEKIINAFVKKLLNVKNNNSKDEGWEILALSNTKFIRNLAMIMSKCDNSKIISDDLIEEIFHSIRYGEMIRYKLMLIENLLIPIYKIISDNKKSELEEYIDEILIKEFNSNLYSVACVNNIIIPNDNFEKELFDEIVILIQARNETNGNISNDLIIAKIRSVINLLYNDKVNNKENLINFKGFDKMYDFIFEPDTFDYNTFEISWLILFDKKHLQKYSEIEVSKIGIKIKFREELLNRNLEKRLKEIYFNYFE